jgi:uncharacterized CHY-type Zn-finger protein
VFKWRLRVVQCCDKKPKYTRNIDKHDELKMHVARRFLEQMRNKYEIIASVHLRELGIDGSIIFKYILMCQREVDSSG